MYEVADIEVYRQKWLEAERDLAIIAAELPMVTPNPHTIDDAEKNDLSSNVLTPSSEKVPRPIGNGNP